VYNNQFVSNGDGGTERRFLFNTILGSGGQESVLEMVRAVCSTMYAKPYWNGSQISFWQERPMSALPKILTNADVEEGKFVYQTRELNTVTTVAKVSYQSTIEDWELVPEIVEEPASIDRYGYQTEEYALLGETRRAAAIRSGRRTILSSLPNVITLTCKIRARAMFFQPGDVIQVSDTARNKVRVGGLVSAVTANKITLDAPITLTANTGKKIFLTLPDESVIERAIANPAGTFTEINLSTPLTTLPIVHSPWQIVDEISRVKLYRITDVAPDSENRSLFEVTAKTYSEDFFTQVETGIKIPKDINQNPLPTEVAPPNNFSVELIKISINNIDTYSLLASWQRPYREDFGTKLSVSSLTVFNGSAIATTTANHNYQTNDLIQISGADQSAYNSRFIITKISNTQFSFTVSNSAPSPVTGNINSVRLIEEPYIKNYRIQYKKSEGSEWNSILETAELSARWDNLTIGDYIVRIAAVTTNNKVSIFIQANNLGAKLVSSFNNKNNSFFAGEF
jgi:predicted phage tail protein